VWYRGYYASGFLVRDMGVCDESHPTARISSPQCERANCARQPTSRCARAAPFSLRLVGILKRLPGIVTARLDITANLMSDCQAAQGGNPLYLSALRHLRLHNGKCFVALEARERSSHKGLSGKPRRGSRVVVCDLKSCKSWSRHEGIW